MSPGYRGTINWQVVHEYIQKWSVARIVVVRAVFSWFRRDCPEPVRADAVHCPSAGTLMAGVFVGRRGPDVYQIIVQAWTNEHSWPDTLCGLGEFAGLERFPAL